MQPSTMSRYARAVSSCHLLTRSRSVVHAAAILAATAWLLATAVDVPSFDSLQYAAAIRAGEGIVHPHHLLYHPAIWLVAQVARWLGAAHPELAAAAIHNALWGGVGAYLVARGLTETTGRLGLGLLGAACLVASSGFAVYATQNDAYVPALVCAVGAFVFAPRSTVISALFWALSTLFHQTGILLAVPLLALLLARFGPARGLHRFIAAAALAGTATLVAYLAVFWVVEDAHSVRAFVTFTLSYAAKPHPAEWGDRRHLSAGGLYTTIVTQVSAIVNLTFWRLRPFVVAAFIGLIAASCVLARKIPEAMAAAAGAVVYVLFNWWWLPSEPELAIVPASFLLLVLIYGCAALTRAIPRWPLLPVAWGAVIVMLLWNQATNGRFPTLIPAEDLQVAARLSSINTDHCTVLDRYGVASAVAYFHHGRAADIRTFMDRRFFEYGGSDDPALIGASCVLVRAQWLDPGKEYAGRSGASHPTEWARALHDLFVTPDGRAASVEPLQDRELGRILRVQRDSPGPSPTAGSRALATPPP